MARVNNWHEDPRFSFLLVVLTAFALVAVLAALGVVVIAQEMRP